MSTTSADSAPQIRPMRTTLPSRVGSPAQHGHSPDYDEESTSTGSSGADTPGPRLHPARRDSTAPGKALVPKFHSQWDAKKHIIYDLYVTQNRKLRDVVEEMERLHRFKATPRMYKRHLGRWNIFKNERRPADEPSGDEHVVAAQRGLSPGQVTPMLHENDGSKNLQGGLTAARHFIQALNEMETSLARQKQRKKPVAPSSCSDPLYRYFLMANGLLDSKEHRLGGQILRFAFLAVDQRLARPTMKSCADICFILPYMLAAQGRREILHLYLRQLSRLAHARLGDHPMSRIIAPLALLANKPELVMQYVNVFSRLNLDAVTEAHDEMDPTTLWAWNQYFCCSSVAANSDEERKHVAHHRKIRCKIQRYDGASPAAEGPPSLNSELVVCALVNGCCDGDFEEWVGEIEEQTRGDTPARTPVTASLEPADRLSATERRAFFCHHLAGYFLRRGDEDQAIAVLRRVEDHSRGELYVIACMTLEGLLRRRGEHEEADKVKRARAKADWIQLLQKKLEA